MQKARGLKRDEGLVARSFLARDFAQRAQRMGERGRAQEIAQGSLRLIHPAERAQAGRCIVQVPEVARVAPGRLAKGGERRFVIAFGAMRQRQRPASGREGGMLAGHGGGECVGLHQLAQRQMCQRDVVAGPEIGGAQVSGSSERFQRFMMPPGRTCRESSGSQLVEGRGGGLAHGSIDGLCWGIEPHHAARKVETF